MNGLSLRWLDAHPVYGQQILLLAITIMVSNPAGPGATIWPAVMALLGAGVCLLDVARVARGRVNETGRGLLVSGVVVTVISSVIAVIQWSQKGVGLGFWLTVLLAAWIISGLVRVFRSVKLLG